MPRAKHAVPEWTTFGRDLFVSIADVPRGRWGMHLRDQIREAIRTGALRPGVQLPASRTLAADLGLSRGVVSGVYDQLCAEGYLTARRGSGTVVSPDLDAAGAHRARPGPSPRIDLSPPRRPGLPDPAIFPRRDWLKAYRTALERLPDGELNYPDPQGYPSLRLALADYLGRVRGIRADADHILIVNGFAQGLAVLARILPGLGVTEIAVEEPGSTGTRTQLRDWGIATPPARVDGHGLRIDDLADTDAAAVLLTPAHHYPTGVVLSPQRRRELLAWVRDRPGRFVIEDDYDAEFRYDNAPIGSLQPLDPQRVITGSSVSKTLAPALRLGWLVLPTELVGPAVHAKATFDLGTSVLNQAALVELLDSGALDRHLRRSRHAYRRKRRFIAEQLTARLADTDITGLDAGLNVCIRLDAGVDDEQLATALTGEGVRCEPLSAYQQRSAPERGLVIDITSTTDQHLASITTAIAGAAHRTDDDPAG